MRYKIVSQNKDLITKAKHTFKLLDMDEAIHIQEVDFWLIDISTLEKESILSYKNKVSYSHFLFVVSESSHIKLCLENEFDNYIKINFEIEELKYWCKYFLDNPKKTTKALCNNSLLDIPKSVIIKDEDIINLTSQELLLLLELSHTNYIPTIKLTKALHVNSQNSIRTIVNRIRKKLDFDIFELKKGFGYKLKNASFKEEERKEIFNNKEKEELEEQNKFLQNIIDSSPIFIATFIHKQLYCINKSFRDFLGKDIIKELWDEEKGDFFKLIIHNSKEYENLKTQLFNKGTNIVKMYDFKENKENSFEVETLYFETLDKHLLVFKILK